MRAGSGWYHVNGNTYGTWLHGDRRGWRSRHGRDRPIGDYKNPPPAGMHERLEEYSRRIMKAEPVLLTTLRQRAAACDAMAEKLLERSVRVLALSVGKEHYHILAKFPDSRVRHRVGLAKKHASHVLRELGLQGQVWARKCRALPIRNRFHQINVFKYIAAHHKHGAFVWTFKEGLLRPE